MKSIHFQVESSSWSRNLEKYECQPKPESGDGPYENASPDKQPAALQKYYAFQLSELLKRRPDPGVKDEGGTVKDEKGKQARTERE